MSKIEEGTSVMEYLQFHVDLNPLNDLKIEFIGREYDFKKLNCDFNNNYKIFGVFGLRSVGKSRFVKEFLKIKNANIVYLDLRNTKDFISLQTHFCASLGAMPKKGSKLSQRYIVTILEQYLQNHSQSENVVLFDNVDNIVDEQYCLNNVEQLAVFQDDFLKLCETISSRLKVFITSTMKVQFLKKFYCSHELLPLQPSDSLKLFKVAAPSVDLGQYQDIIIKLSEGLPLLMLMICAELNNSIEMRMTPKSMAELLLQCRLETLSRDIYSEDKQVSTVYRKFVERLSHVYQTHFSVLNYIPGSFEARQASQLLDQSHCRTAALTKVNVLSFLRNRHMISFDSISGRFDIQGILREILNAHFTLSDTDLADLRTRYCCIYAPIMVNIALGMRTQYAKAMSDFSYEQPNLQKLLNEATYTNENNYCFFKEMATQCSDMIEVFFANESEHFYCRCLEAADKYSRNKDIDKAGINIALGSMYTNSKGELKAGLQRYECALKLLNTSSKSSEVALVYQRIGWNLHQQGNNVGAVRFCQKSLEISQVSGKQLQWLYCQSLSTLGISYVQLGNFAEAELCHFKSLELRRQEHGENHPNIGKMYNNIAHLFDDKGDKVQALEYFKKGLDIKRTGNVSGVSLVDSLNNVASAYTSSEQYKEAHKLLDEAIELLKAEKIQPQISLALICNTRGRVFAKEGRLIEAKEMLKVASNIRAVAIPDSFEYAETLKQLAMVHFCLKEYTVCCKVLNKALSLKDAIIKNVPHYVLISECLQCLAYAHHKLGDMDMYRETLYQLESELIRLKFVCIDICDERKLEHVYKMLGHVKSELSKIKLIDIIDLH